MKVRFTDVFSYVPTLEPRVSIKFKPTGGPKRDGVYTVKRECGERAVASGKAVAVAEEPVLDAPPAAPSEPE